MTSQGCGGGTAHSEQTSARLGAGRGRGSANASVGSRTGPLLSPGPGGRGRSTALQLALGSPPPLSLLPPSPPPLLAAHCQVQTLSSSAPGVTCAGTQEVGRSRGPHQGPQQVWDEEEGPGREGVAGREGLRPDSEPIRAGTQRAAENELGATDGLRGQAFRPGTPVQKLATSWRHQGAPEAHSLGPGFCG